MTLEQKVQHLSNDVRPARIDSNRPPGYEFQEIRRHIQGIPELAIPTVRIGGTGLRRETASPRALATGLPSTPTSAATFKPDLNRQLRDTGAMIGDPQRLRASEMSVAKIWLQGTPVYLPKRYLREVERLLPMTQ